MNVHTSLLPKYRGAAPIQWAIANGESETGVTIMKMDVGMDTGDILTQRATPSTRRTTADAARSLGKSARRCWGHSRLRRRKIRHPQDLRSRPTRRRLRGKWLHGLALPSPRWNHPRLHVAGRSPFCQITATALLKIWRPKCPREAAGSSCPDRGIVIGAAKAVKVRTNSKVAGE
jgi:hypothetical protein